MRAVRFCARVRRRLGIIAVRSPHGSVLVAVGKGLAPAGAHKLGNGSALPGIVTYVCPDGDVRISVPSRNWVSRQPQNVFTK